MIVCHCKAVNDRTIREAVRNGASSPRQVALACNAGRRCGGCRSVIRQIIAAETENEAASGLQALGLAAAS